MWLAPSRHQDESHVFDKFFQVESGSSRQYGGTGLGLALARAIVVAHGGSIHVRSTPGLGSIFTIYLPSAPPS